MQVICLPNRQLQTLGHEKKWPAEALDSPEADFGRRLVVQKRLERSLLLVYTLFCVGGAILISGGLLATSHPPANAATG